MLVFENGKTTSHEIETREVLKIATDFVRGVKYIQTPDGKRIKSTRVASIRLTGIEMVVSNLGAGKIRPATDVRAMQFMKPQRWP